MRVSETGLTLIRSSEGLAKDAYLDRVGIPTIGYGHTAGVKMGTRITMAMAESYLAADVARFGDGVANLVKVKLSQGQFDALVSFAYNLGLGALQESTLLRKLNAGDYAGAADEFPRWVHAGAEVLPGLVTRRAAERALFLKAAPAPASAPKPAPAPASMRLFAPASDPKVNMEVTDEQLKALEWMAGRLGLVFKVDTKLRKVFLDLPRAAPAAKWSVEPLAQSNSVSCGQTSVAMACNALTGKMLRDTDIQAKHGFSLLAALNAESGRAWVDGGDEDASDWPTIEAKLLLGPVVIGLNGPTFSPSGRGHIVLITGIDGSQVTFADPAYGKFRQVTKAAIDAAPPHPDGKFLFWLA